MKRLFVLFFIVLLMGPLVQGAKLIPNGSTSQTITVPLRDAAGAPVTGITIANLDLYVVRDGDKISAKTDLSALSSASAAWTSGKAYEIGQGLYRIDIPDANLADGEDQLLTYIVDDAVGANVTTYYEVQLTGEVDTVIPPIISGSSPTILGALVLGMAIGGAYVIRKFRAAGA